MRIKVKNIIKFSSLVILLSILSGCGGEWWNLLFERNREIELSCPKEVISSFSVKNGEVLEIGGKCIVKNGATITLEPGSKVKFKTIELIQLPADVEEGKLIFLDNGKLLARGTKQNPIVFFTAKENVGWLSIEESGNLEGNILEYCKFEGRIIITYKGISSLTIRYSKFIFSWISLYSNGNLVVEHNDFSAPSAYDGIIYHAISGVLGVEPVIQFNTIAGYWIPLNVTSAVVKFNNITGSGSYAISAGSSECNYIANCNGKIGIDTNGEQVASGVPFSNPQITQIAGAGSGW